MVLATYRDVELRREHPLADALGELARQQLSQRILLRGLTERDVARFIELTAGRKPPEALVDAVYRETEGNPFFVNEIVRLLVADGRLERPEEVKSWSVTIPQGVREVVGRRLDHLSDACNRALTTASVIGREFGLDALERVSDVTNDRLLEALEEAAAARVVTEIPRAVGRYSFTHALIRETLYEELGTTRRVRLHRQIGEVLETINSDNLEPHLPELAHHFSESAQGGDVDKAIDYATRAAKRAMSLTAYEDAAGHYEMAIQALEVREKPDEAQRCGILLAFGEALWNAGDPERAGEIFLQAADIARKLAAGEHLARAALGLGGPIVSEWGVADERLVALLKEALNALGEEDNRLRARVLARLAQELSVTAPESAEPLSREAVEVARRLGEPTTLAYALIARYWALWGPDNVDDRLAIATEIVSLGQKSGDRWMEGSGHDFRAIELLMLGDIPAADVEIEAYKRVAEELRLPMPLWLTAVRRAARALLDGRFEEGERLAQEALAVGQRAQSQLATQVFVAQTSLIRGLQGRFSDADVAAFEGFVEQYPTEPSWRVVLAQAYLNKDRNTETRREFELLAAGDFSDLPRGAMWLANVASLSQVCAFLGDDRRASRASSSARRPGGISRQRAPLAVPILRS